MTGKGISSSAYQIATWTIVIALSLAGAAAKPFDRILIGITGPTLVLLACLPWFLLSRNIGWRTAGTYAALAAILIVVALRIPLRSENISIYRIVAVVGISTQLVMLCIYARDRVIVSIAFAQTLTVLFLILMAADFRLHPVAVKLRTERLLFWAPLAAMAIWVNAALSRWRRANQIIFILFMLQLCIGFIDLGAVAGDAWTWVAAGFFFLIAFSLVIRWAEQLNARGSERI
jgi:hypothetical protein